MPDLLPLLLLAIVVALIENPIALMFLASFLQWVIVFCKNIRYARSYFQYEPFFRNTRDRNFWLMIVGLFVCGFALTVFPIVGYQIWFVQFAMAAGRFFIFESVVGAFIWALLGGGNPPAKQVQG